MVTGLSAVGLSYLSDDHSWGSGGEETEVELLELLSLFPSLSQCPSMLLSSLLP